MSASGDLMYWPRKDENEEEGSNQASDTEQVHNRSWLLLCRKTSERRGPSLSKPYKIRLPHLDSSSTLLSCPSPGPPSLLFRTGRTRDGIIIICKPGVYVSVVVLPSIQDTFIIA